MIRLSRISLYLTIFAVMGGPCSAQSASCPGPLLQPHPHPFGTFNFETDSVYDAATRLPGVISGGDFQFGIVSCVTNPDPSNPLRVNWLIPGPDGWVQPSDRLYSVPRLTNATNPLQLSGCLEYGNQGNTTQGKFFGLSDDQPKIDDEHRRGCRAVIVDPRPSKITSIKDIILKFINYIPSDTKNAAKTMLKLEGTVGVRRIEENTYTSFVSYQITKTAGSAGSPEAIRFRPIFRGLTESLLPAFFKKNGADVKASSKGAISFDVFGVTNPQLLYASYAIIGENSEVVGSVRLPVFVSGSPLLPRPPAGEFGKFIASETEKWAKVVKFANIKAE